MPRPHTKADLIVETESEYAVLEQFLAALSPEQMVSSGALGEWSVKDILAHLYEWQRMFFSWYEAGLHGENPQLPAAGYKWNQLPALNHAIYLRYRELPLDEVLNLFRASHRQTLALVHALSADELTQPGHYAWAGKHALCGFISANCGSHYRWARTEMRKSLRKGGIQAA
jgi:hypothetical protein